jgi:hypothetical protein
MELALPEENLSSFSAQQAALRLQRRLDFEWFGGDLEVARREGAVVVKDYEKILARTPEDLEVKGLRILTGLHHASALALLGGPENCDKARDELIRLMNLESDVRFSEQFQDVVEWAKFAKDPVFLRESAVAANMGCIESVLLISKLNHEQPKNPKPLLESLRKVLSLKPEMLRDERFTEFAKKLDAGRDKEFVAASARARAELEKRD